MLRNKLAVLVVVVAAVIGLTVGLAGLKLWKLARGARSVQPLSTVAVIQKVQTLSELVTVKYVLEQVVPYEPPSETTWQALLDELGFARNRLLLLAHGEVRAGVDLSQVTPTDLVINGRDIMLTLPPPSILDAHLVENRTQVLDWRNASFRGFDQHLEQKARQEGLLRIKDAARQGGIERDAAERAQRQLTAFLQALGFTRVEIRTSSRDAATR